MQITVLKYTTSHGRKLRHPLKPPITIEAARKLMRYSSATIGWNDRKRARKVGWKR